MSERYPGGLIRKTPPTVTGPTDGEGGSAPGIWTLEEVAYYEKEGQWPKKTLQRPLLTSGDNWKGNLGTSDAGSVERSSPVQVGSDTNWDYVNAAVDHAQALKRDGTLWEWGDNGNGNLGQNNRISTSSPVQVGAETGWTKIAGYESLAYGIRSGRLYFYGSASNGASGLNVNTNRSSPTQIGALADWADVSGYSFGALALKTDGTLWSWGLNSQGAVGNNTTLNVSSPVQIGSDTWISIGGGESSRAAVRSDGTLWTWGSDAFGQLGQNTRNIHISSPTQVGALTNWAVVRRTQNGILAFKTDNTIWVCGNGQNGEMGDGTAISRSSPIQVAADKSWANTYAGRYGSYGKTDTGQLWWWGFVTKGENGNNVGFLGSSSPIQIGSDTNWGMASSYDFGMFTRII